MFKWFCFKKELFCKILRRLTSLSPQVKGLTNRIFTLFNSRQVHSQKGTPIIFFCGINIGLLYNAFSKSFQAFNKFLRLVWNRALLSKILWFFSAFFQTIFLKTCTKNITIQRNFKYSRILNNNLWWPTCKYCFIFPDVFRKWFIFLHVQF